MKLERSVALFNEAKVHIPGGVNSPVRSFASVGGTPRFIEQAHGDILTDVDGNTYIDLLNSWGPMILGHGEARVRHCLHEQLDRGISYGAPTSLEVELAQLITCLVPGIERVRLTSSGTEACMSAVRLARGMTGRSRIIKAAGCYHGHADAFLVAAGSGLLSMGTPTSAGVTLGAAHDTTVVPYNDAEAIVDAIAKGDVAAVILEPVAGNMGCIPPVDGYLAAIRKACTTSGTLLIFDEVMTGFRLAIGGAQDMFGITADIVTFGKVIGGGMPIGAVAARASIMDMFAPLGPVYQAGTLSGNPLAVTCGLATLSILDQDRTIYERINASCAYLAEQIRQLCDAHNNKACVNQCGSMLSIFFGVDRVVDLDTAMAADTTTYSRFFHSMLNHGVMLPPSAFETWFVSNALTDEHIAHVLRAVDLSLAELRVAR
ncbi:MAG TPA: glutamate-1-semialdehyde 2,1-aminomutase [Candidatus Didemnitutus sp.]|nr:glutamate-1-semialdehyde 2,1-aminomutase [Candidatus Didemnitutus sp.]